MTKVFKRGMKYFSKHLMFADAMHAAGGLGVGIMIARPFDGGHPIRWGLAFLAVAILGHVWALTHS